MFIFKDTLKRANPYASYTEPNGTFHVRIPLNLIEEIPDPVPPEDYSDHLYYRTETDDAPYVIYTRKSDEQIAEYQAGVIASKIEQLWSAADRHINSYISGVAVGLLTIGVIQQKPKALAITLWSQAVWNEYYVRKAAVTFDSVLDLDFSSFGPMPHSVPELQAEVFGQ
jgi:hypothetical protein